MKFNGTRKVKLSAIRSTGDVGKRRGTDRVRELAASIKANGLAHLPVVDGHNALVIGRDRVAALLDLGTKTIEVREVEGTPSELKLLEIAENLHRRRDDIDDLRAQYVELMEDQTATTQHAGGAPDHPPSDAASPPTTQSESSITQSAIVGSDFPKIRSESSPTRGRPRASKTDAIEKLAEAEGVTPRAIRMALARAEAKKALPEPPTTAEPVVVAHEPPPVEMWGLDPAPYEADLVEIRRIQEILRKADQHIQQAQRVLHALMEGGQVPRQIHDQIYPDVHHAASRVREFMPEWLCPFCKGVKPTRARCGTCKGFGFTPDLGEIPHALKLTGAKAMITNGHGGFKSIHGDVS